MSVKERPGLVLDPKVLMISIIFGFGIYVLINLLWALLISIRLISYDLIFLLPKISLLVSAMSACAYAVKKGRGEAFINSLSAAVLIYACSIMSASLFPDINWDTSSAVICLLICILSCLIMTLQKKKNSRG